MGRPRKTSSELGRIAEMIAGSHRTYDAESGPVALDIALEDLAEKKGVKFVNFRRIGSRGGKLSIRGSKMYYMLKAQAPDELRDREKVDDFIYDELERQLDLLS